MGILVAFASEILNSPYVALNASVVYAIKGTIRNTICYQSDPRPTNKKQKQILHGGLTCIFISRQEIYLLFCGGQKGSYIKITYNIFKMVWFFSNL